MEHPPSFNVRNNIYVTTSANCSLEALLCALLAVNADHILFSTDYLYAPLDRLSRCIGTAPIGETDQEKTCHLTAYFIDLGQVANARDYP